jgi:hypothetical protein
VWTDGDTSTKERHDSAATGRLLSSTDTTGNVLTYSYTGNLLTLRMSSDLPADLANFVF